MIRLPIVLIFLAISFGVQVLLSRTYKWWPGLILPLIHLIIAVAFFIYNLNEAFLNLESYGQFLIQYGWTGLFALVIKSSVIFVPTILLLLIYWFFRHQYNKKHSPPSKDKAYRKMMAKDLD